VRDVTVEDRSHRWIDAVAEGFEVETVRVEAGGTCRSCRQRQN
jgi:Fe2+ or Zn2+ uptake regulation protein